MGLSVIMDLNGECKGGGGDGFIDRSRVRILLCDNDPNSLGEVFTLLSQCSYQGMIADDGFEFFFFFFFNSLYNEYCGWMFL